MRDRQGVFNLLEGWISAAADSCVFQWADTVQRYYFELGRYRLRAQGSAVLRDTRTHSLLGIPRRTRRATLGSKSRVLSFAESFINQLLLCTSVGLEFICCTRSQAKHSGIWLLVLTCLGCLKNSETISHPH